MKFVQTRIYGCKIDERRLGELVHFEFQEWSRITQAQKRILGPGLMGKRNDLGGNGSGLLVFPGQFLDLRFLQALALSLSERPGQPQNYLHPHFGGYLDLVLP